MHVVLLSWILSIPIFIIYNYNYLSRYTNFSHIYPCFYCNTLYSQFEYLYITLVYACCMVVMDTFDPSLYIITITKVGILIYHTTTLVFIVIQPFWISLNHTSLKYNPRSNVRENPLKPCLAACLYTLKGHVIKPIVCSSSFKYEL